MKINPQYKVRNVAGENIVVNFGTLNVNTTKIIALNEVALWLWNQCAGEEFTTQSVQNLLCQNYNISPEQALQDAQKWIDGLQKANLIQE